MNGEAKPLESPDAFLDALGKLLKKQEGLDTDLADILTTHILKAAPAPNAVAQAKGAIMNLAVKRANPPKVEMVNG
ncbi:hypothetical protein GCM10011505_51170 [Tistrella bauzanensis]|uniref:Uncharacterized protein n=1 Tax=Tistrella bauzanensis TaxID=657419 RepID=A0ABQ1JEA7_9PROT|nr:hypothetical protein [Tistrella bauzanensis]GGB64671.1 hypothetical protein GCM10011505_51170 [Tistrella bauzanensis]